MSKAKKLYDEAKNLQTKTAIIFCGGLTQGQRISEADAMYSYFKSLNAVAVHPFPEHPSKNQVVVLIELTEPANLSFCLCDWCF